MKNLIPTLLLLVSAPAFAASYVNQEVADALAKNTVASELLKVVENNYLTNCTAPGDEETAINEEARTFSADYVCKGSPVASSVSVSGDYAFRSDGAVMVRVTALKINDSL